MRVCKSICWECTWFEEAFSDYAAYEIVYDHSDNGACGDVTVLMKNPRTSELVHVEYTWGTCDDDTEAPSGLCDTEIVFDSWDMLVEYYTRHLKCEIKKLNRELQNSRISKLLDLKKKKKVSV